MIAPLPNGLVQDIVARSLSEDLGGHGDVTSLATIDDDTQATFTIMGRDDGVFSGQQAAQAVFDQVDRQLKLNWLKTESAKISKGDCIASIEGKVQHILIAERTALNFMGRMSGIATLTAQYVKAIEGANAVITHTRKTTPGLRALELQAVRAGGGSMHRYGLDDAVLIKDNHVASCGSVGEAIRRARAYCGHMKRISAEIDRLDQLDEALNAGAETILLDNFSIEDLSHAVRRTDGKVTLEASGGITLANVKPIADTGVDVISIGALTHSAPNFDLGLDAV